jgi:Uma2 family endonuclease
MPPQKDEHAMTVRLCEEAARRAFGEGFVYCVQMPLDLGPGSEPEPDIAVVRGALRSVKKHPKTALLVIEVSDTTLAYDRGRKASLYASRGIRDYWVVNLVEHCVEVHRRPARNVKSAFGFTYVDVRTYAVGESVVPLAAKRASVQITDLLP